MINDDFNFMFDDSEFPVSIEEFAAYLDGNLSDDEMQRVSSVIEKDEEMQGVMDGMEQSEQTLAEYGQDDMQVPEELEDMNFFIPESIDTIVAEDYYGNDSFEIPQIEEYNHSEEFYSDVDHNEINNIDETFDPDSDTSINYGEHLDL